MDPGFFSHVVSFLAWKEVEFVKELWKDEVAKELKYDN